MKNLQRILLAAVLFLGALSAKAQPDGGMDCNCPDPSPEEVVCVLIDANSIAAFPSACYAECLGLTVVDGDCNIDGGPIDPVDPFDCDCPEPVDNELICVSDELGNVFPFPSACIAACVGLEVVDCGDNFPGDGNGGGGDPWGCDCPEPSFDEWVCAIDEFGDILPVPSACFAACMGMELADCGDNLPGDGNGGGGDPFDCDCPEPVDNELICVSDELGNVFPFPSACIAACVGLEVVDCGDNFPGDGNGGGGDPWGCDCPEPSFDEWVCAIDEFGDILPVPSACFAACMGMELADCGDNLPGDGNGGGGDPWGCDCPEPSFDEWVCAIDEFGDILPVPSACFAACMGMELADCGDNLPGDGNGGGDPSGCDCPEPTDGELICVSDEMGNVFAFPSICLAECLGFTVADCGDGFPGDGNGGNPDDCGCPEPADGELICVSDEYGNIFPFPSACLAECFGLTVVEGDCFIDFPGDGNGGNGGDFECDCPEPTIDDLVTITLEDGTVICLPSLCIAECLGFTGDDFEFLPGDLFGTLSFEVALNGDNDFGGAIEELDIYPNPVEDMLYLSIKANGDGVTNVKLYSLIGQIVYEEQVTLSSGTQRLELPLNNLPSGSYILGVADGNGKLVTKNVVKTN